MMCSWEVEDRIRISLTQVMDSTSSQSLPARATGWCFGAGINPNAIIVAVSPNDSLVVRMGIGGDGVEILHFGAGNLDGSHPIDSFEFSESATLTYSQLAAGGLGITGNLGHDRLIGTVQGDRIFGWAGNDLINADSGDDVVFWG